jgi:2-methylcitrate dehydratase PrpD
LIAGYETLHERLEPLVQGLGLGSGSGDVDASQAARRARRVAYLGGAYAHCWEIDDINRASTVCPGCVVLPAVLAAVELRPEASWDQLIGAYLAGYEVTLGAAYGAATDELITTGWWPTSLFAPTGAAAAVSVLLGHSEQQTADAISLAAQQAGGLLTGTNDGRYLNAGIAAERGLCSALVADAGWTGPADVFEHDRSPLRRRDPQQHSEPPGIEGEPFIGRTSVKAHAAAKHLQAAVDVILNLRANPGWSVDRITELRCELPASVARVVNRPAPFTTATGALASAQYILALTAITGTCYPRQFTAAYREDPEIVSLAAKVRIVASDALSHHHPEHWGARVEVITSSTRTDGEKLDADGDPETPLSDGELISKFVAVAGPQLGTSQAGDLASDLLTASADVALSRLHAEVMPLFGSRVLAEESR